MSKAIRCDRCKKCFAPVDLKEKFFLTIKDIFVQDGDDYSKYTVDRFVGLDELNLCPECTQEFYRFMRILSNPEIGIRKSEIAKETTP